jgi:glycosyltransferase involved in cell wall biosynthesis
MTALLTVSIPTYHRSDKLRLMLQALIPQAVAMQGLVDVVVRDNASEDDTQAVVQEFQKQFPIRYFNNEINIGGIINVILCGAAQLKSEYVWIVGDDDILAPGALQKVCTTLQQYPEFDAIYINNRVGDYDTQWPADAHGGYAGPCLYLQNDDVTDKVVERWESILKPTNGIATQIYAHVIRVEMWRKYWHGVLLDKPLTSVQGTYPHTKFVAETMFGRPCYYIGQPLVTIFDGAQSWTHLRPLVNIICISDLIRFYHQLGLKGPQYRAIKSYIYHTWCGGALFSVLHTWSGPYWAWRFMQGKWFDLTAWSALKLSICQAICFRATDSPANTWTGFAAKLAKSILPASAIEWLKFMRRS